jgi:transketolase
MDANETSIAWEIALNRKNGPSALVLTRQSLNTVERSVNKYADAINAKKGAYILSDDFDSDILLAASGSEVEIALKAKEILNQKGIEVRVVSVLSFEIFEQQTEAYKMSVFPEQHKHRIAIEAAVSMPWHKYIGEKGDIISINRFGASAPYEVLYEKLQITANQIVTLAEKFYAESQ